MEAQDNSDNHVSGIEIIADVVRNGRLRVINGSVWRAYATKYTRAENTVERGYKQVQVWKNGIRFICMAHELVWHMERGPVPENHVVHHINKDVGDNRIENLVPLSYHEHNSIHAKERRVWQTIPENKGDRVKEWHAKTVASKEENYQLTATNTARLWKLRLWKLKDLAKALGCTTRTI